MKIHFIVDSQTPWISGIWYHRNKMPSEALGTRGHYVRQYTITQSPPPQEMINDCDTVIFGRTYPVGFNPVRDMQLFKKAGKRVLFDIDDDFWQVAKDNPSVLVSSSLKDQYEELIRNCDAVTTPSPILAKKIKKHFKKPVFICPNAINYDDYRERDHTKRDELFIGYMGASSHWKDLTIMVEALEKLSEKYDFYTYFYGLTAGAWEGEYYNARKMLEMNLMPEKREYLKSIVALFDKIKKLKMIHKPFCPPEIHPMILTSLDLDIGLAPLEDNEFNRGKSNIKFYEYASTGTVTLASDVHPYKEECDYRAKNTVKDWYKKLEKLIVDKEFRDKLQRKQSEWVVKNRSVEAVALAWEKACQKPGGLKVLNQTK